MNDFFDFETVVLNVHRCIICKLLKSITTVDLDQFSLNISLFVELFSLYDISFCIRYLQNEILISSLSYLQ